MTRSLDEVSRLDKDVWEALESKQCRRFDTRQKNKTMTRQDEEIERLEAEASEAGKEASQLESKLSGIPRMVDDLQHQLNQAKIRRERAITKLRQLKPIPMPPVPSMEKLMMEANRQCPGRDQQVLNRMVGMFHAAAVTGSNSGESFYSRGATDVPEITGDARDVADSSYDIPPLPPERKPLPDSDWPPAPELSMPTREKKSYG